MKAGAVAATRGALGVANQLHDQLRPPQPGIVILAYHRVGGRTRTSVDLPTDVFRSQMELLAGSGLAISLSEAVRRLRPSSSYYGGRDDPLGRSIAEQQGAVRIDDLDWPPIDPAVVVTFDDGTADWVDEALPILEATGVPAAFYVATRYVDEQVEFPGGGRPISWRGLGELDASHLVELGSHTHSHLLLDRASPRQAARDIDASRYLMAERLGKMPTHFAYPKALAGVGVVGTIVKQRFESAVLAGNRVNVHPRDLYRLGRHPVQRNDRLEQVQRKMHGSDRLEGLLRQSILPLRERKNYT